MKIYVDLGSSETIVNFWDVIINNRMKGIGYK